MIILYYVSMKNNRLLEEINVSKNESKNNKYYNELYKLKIINNKYYIELKDIYEKNRKQEISNIDKKNGQ